MICVETLIYLYLCSHEYTHIQAYTHMHAQVLALSLTLLVIWLLVCSVLNGIYMQNIFPWSGLKCDINTCFFLKRHLFMIMDSLNNPQTLTDTFSSQMSRKQEISKAKTAIPLLVTFLSPNRHCSPQHWLVIVLPVIRCQTWEMYGPVVLCAEALAWLQCVTAHNSAIQLVKPYSHVNQWTVH